MGDGSAEVVEMEMVDNNRPNRLGYESKWPRLEDIGGMSEAIKKLKRELFILRTPEMRRHFGLPAATETKILLEGPLGCGKTMLVEAFANENGLEVYKLESGISVSIEEIRELLSEARSKAPSIVFIKGIEAMKLTNRLIEPVGDNAGCIMVIGATDEPYAMDLALRRCFIRFPRRRCPVEILSVLTSKAKVADDVDLRKIARATASFVGLDLKAVVDKATDLE